MEVFNKCDICRELKNPSQGRTIIVREPRAIVNAVGTLIDILKEDSAIWVCYRCIGKGESIERYWDEGESLEEMGRAFGRSRSTMRWKKYP